MKSSGNNLAACGVVLILVAAWSFLFWMEHGD